MQVNKTIDSAFEYLAFLPDSVHVGKSLKCSFCKWFIILNGETGSQSIIQTLRDDSNPVMRKKLQKLLKPEDVQNRDRMAVHPIIRLSSLEVQGSQLRSSPISSCEVLLLGRATKWVVAGHKSL